ncbi:hypothetical protein P9209_02500 [Prescottella defluvii]|nr:hypothetical protein P9209_02500 [Prescottella defluvii]
MGGVEAGGGPSNGTAGNGSGWLVGSVLLVAAAAGTTAAGVGRHRRRL